MQNFINKVRNELTINAPHIIFGASIGGLICGCIYAISKTPKAHNDIQKRKEELNVEKLPAKEILKTSYKYYIGPVIIGTLSLSGLITSYYMVNKKNAILATAYTLAERTFLDYKDKVIETIGERKEEKIRDKIEEDKVKEIDPKYAIVTGLGTTLYYDKFCGRAFYCDKKAIEDALLKISQDIYSYDSADLNSFYEYINLDRTVLAENYIWDIDKLKGHSIKFKPKYGPAKNDDPMCIIGFDYEPEFNRNLLRY